MRVEYVRQTVPAALLECAPEPAVPAEVTDAAVALLLVDLAEAGEDCRGKLTRVRGLVELSNDR